MKESCWIDLDGIESDAQFVNVIVEAINRAQVFLFMYSRHHAEIKDYDNDWTTREINYAQKRKKRIVFINIDGSQLTDWFELMFGMKQQLFCDEKTLQRLGKMVRFTITFLSVIYAIKPSKRYLKYVKTNDFL